MSMYDTINKTAGKAEWVYTHEFTTERIFRTRSGNWLYANENGGERGAWERRANTVTPISAQEAAAKLIEWGFDESSFTKELKEYTIDDEA